MRNIVDPKTIASPLDAVSRRNFNKGVIASGTAGYSGRTGSAFLAWAAHQVLRPRMLAVRVDSPSLRRQDLKSAVSSVEQMQISLKIVVTEEMARPERVRNDSTRCLHCDVYEVSARNPARRPSFYGDFGVAQVASCLASGADLHVRSQFALGISCRL